MQHPESLRESHEVECHLLHPPIQQNGIYEMSDKYIFPVLGQ